MSEPLPPAPQTPEAPQAPKKITIGETELYLSTPMTVGDKTIDSIVIQPTGKRGAAGAESSVLLVSEPSRKKGEEGVLVDKPVLHVDPMDEMDWDKVSGVQWTDDGGVSHTIPKKELSLEKPAPSAEPVPDVSTDTAPHQEEPAPQPPETAPQPKVEARKVLETLTEDPNTITIVGLRAYETRALDLADRAMQRLGAPRQIEQAEATKNLWDKTKDTIRGVDHFVKDTLWKQSIGSIFFHERAREYYLDMLKAAETPFAEQSIRLAEARAAERYTQKLNDANFLVRAGTKVVDYLKDSLGMRTAIQTMALEEIGSMKAAGELKGAEVFEREAKAVRARFSQDIDTAASYIRSQLGEKMEILDPSKEEHKPLVEGIQSLFKQYVSGEIADKTTFDQRTKEFFNATLKNIRPDIFAEAELYSSSLFETAEMLKTKLSHEAGMENIADAMAGLQIRLGIGSMGEVTSLEPTAVERGISRVREITDWLQKKNVLVPMVFNEAAVGTGVALALSATNLIKTMPARMIGGLGGGALAGGLFAGWKEYGQLQKDYLTHLREREAGTQFTETQKRRSWFESFSVKQRTATDMMTTISAAMEQHDYKTAMATIADLHARKAISETGPKRIGLVQYSNREVIESERAALDVLANRALSDLGARSDLGDLTGGLELADFMEKLTVAQTAVLKKGVDALSGEDAIIAETLGIVSQYAPEIALSKRRFPLAGKELPSDLNASGLDAILEEFKKEARSEAIKYGVKAGVIGAAVGASIHAVSDLFAHTSPIPEQVSHATQSVKDAVQNHTEAATMTAQAAHGVEVPVTPPSADHVISIGGKDFQLPKELSIIAHTSGGPDERVTTYDAVIHTSGGPVKDITIGSNLEPQSLLSKLHDAGFTVNEGHAAIPDASKVTYIPGLEHPIHDAHMPIQIPPDYQVVQSGSEWNLINGNHDIIAHGMQFSKDGNLLNVSDIKPQLDAHHLTLDTSHTVTLKGIDHIPLEQPASQTAETLTSLPNDMPISGAELGKGGLWDYFLGKTHDVSAANGLKNLFRIYEHQNGTSNIEFPNNSPHVGYIEQHLREATLGSEHGKIDVDLTRIPNDATIKVPETLFGKTGVEHFLDIQKDALTDYQATLSHADIKGPIDAINHMYESGDPQQKLEAIVLRLGYLGQDDKLPTDPKDLALLYEGLAKGSVSHVAEASPVEHIQQFVDKPYEFTAHTMIIKEIPQPAAAASIIAEKGSVTIPYSLPSELAAGVSEAAKATYDQWPGGMDESVRAAMHETGTIAAATAGAKVAESTAAWLPVVLPLHQALEMAPVESIAIHKPQPKESYLSPNGNEAEYLSKEAIQASLSPRLTENPGALLTQSEEIAWYLSTLSEREQQVLSELNAQYNEPISPDVRAVVSFPASGVSAATYQRLSSYTTQTMADNTPFDPKRVEFVVYDINPGEQSTIKADVERFRTEHPDLSVIYLTKTYTEPSLTSGTISRDLSTYIMNRVGTLPPDHPDVAVVTDNTTGNAIEPTYLSSIIETFDAKPTVDVLSGALSVPSEAYAAYPLLFAHYRTSELFDAFIRHGETGGVPDTYSGNIAVRAGTLAAVGGYRAQSPIFDDRELSWVIRSARQNPDAISNNPAMNVSLDPKDTIYYTYMQPLGLAEKIPLSENTTYKDASWQTLADKTSEAFTKDHLESYLNSTYQHMYPTLKATNPARFDAYFRRAMDTLGIGHTIENGAVVVTDTTNLEANMKAAIDTESFAKDAARQVISETPSDNREALEAFAGEKAPEQAAQQAEPTEPLAASLSSPEVAASEPPVATNEATPKPPEQPLPEGVEDRVAVVLNATKESQAQVAITPMELMDYIKTRVELPVNTRITAGTISVDGQTVKLSDMIASSPVGEATFSGTMKADPKTGLAVDPSTVTYKLPMLMRLFEGRIKHSIETLGADILAHMDKKVPQHWNASRVDVVGDKLTISFAKKP